MKVGAGETAMKTCTKCGEAKALNEFHKNQTACKLCKKAWSAANYQKNSERINAVSKNWRDSNPERVRNINLRAKNKLKGSGYYLRPDVVEMAKTRQARYVTKHKDRVTKSKARYREKNKDSLLVKNRDYAYRSRRDPLRKNIIAQRNRNLLQRYRELLPDHQVRKHIRDMGWKVAVIPPNLIEIERKLIQIHRLLNQKEAAK